LSQTLKAGKVKVNNGGHTGIPHGGSARPYKPEPRPPYTARRPGLEGSIHFSWIGASPKMPMIATLPGAAGADEEAG